MAARFGWSPSPDTGAIFVSASLRMLRKAGVKRRRGTRQMINQLTNTRPAEILLVEDNENDVELTRIGLKKSKLLLNLHHAKDGVECMEFLRKQGAYGNAPRPDLILLDLNMPRMDGREVLAEIVADEALCNL